MSDPNKEQTFLDDLKKKFETNDKGKSEKMSGMEKRIHDRLTLEAQEPGDLTQAQITQAVNEEIEGAVKGAIDGSIKYKDLVKVSTGNRIVNAFKKEAEKVGKTVERAIQGEDGQTKTVKSRISAEEEKNLRAEVTLEEVIAVAEAVGLEKGKASAPGKATAKTPGAKTPAPAQGATVESMIKAAAGADHILSKPELDKLLNDPAFLNTAKLLAPTDVKITNNEGKDFDGIQIGTNKAIHLSELDVSLADFKKPNVPDNNGFKQGTTTVKTR